MWPKVHNQSSWVAFWIWHYCEGINDLYVLILRISNDLIIEIMKYFSHQVNIWLSLQDVRNINFFVVTKIPKCWVLGEKTHTHTQHTHTHPRTHTHTHTHTHKHTHTHTHTLSPSTQSLVWVSSRSCIPSTFNFYVRNIILNSFLYCLYYLRKGLSWNSVCQFCTKFCCERNTRIHTDITNLSQIVCLSNLCRYSLTMQGV